MSRSLAIAAACRTADGENWYPSCLEGVLGVKDFDWPWLNQWLAVFAAREHYPEAIFQYEFEPPGEPVAPPYANVDDVLNGMTVPELRQLARAHDISLKGATRKSDIRIHMAHVIQWKDVCAWASEKNGEQEQKTRIKRTRAKLALLSCMISGRFYNLHRHGQIVDLLKTMNTNRKPCLENHSEHNSGLACEFIQAWRFDPYSWEYLPPFFPGDTTTLETSRT
ncbi:MAG: hypothetical protein LBJ59_11950 [Zoogloeaceae bacterium]|nr:hypothetical protein [Zoogloeaceae bacterium]